MNYRGAKRAAILTAAAALAATGIAFAAPANAATGSNIDQWTPSTSCLNSPYLYCLWYHQGQGTGGAGWGSTNTYTATISGTFFIGGSGAAGYGQPVRNNAASMSNGTVSCNVTTWVSPGRGGDWNWLSPSYGGNLTPGLHNNEASIDANNCS